MFNRLVASLGTCAAGTYSLKAGAVSSPVAPAANDGVVLVSVRAVVSAPGLLLLMSRLSLPVLDNATAGMLPYSPSVAVLSVITVDDDGAPRAQSRQVPTLPLSARFGDWAVHWEAGHAMAWWPDDSATAALSSHMSCLEYVHGVAAAWLPNALEKAPNALLGFGCSGGAGVHDQDAALPYAEAHDEGDEPAAPARKRARPV